MQAKYVAMGVMQYRARTSAMEIVVAIAAVSACGPINGHKAISNSQATSDTHTMPTFAPMQAADILRSAMGCLQPPPYPIDGGPTCLRADGTWISYNGWANREGRFRIVGNKVIMTWPTHPAFPVEPSSIALYRDREGNMFVNDDPIDAKRPLRRLKPYPEADYQKNLK